MNLLNKNWLVNKIVDENLASMISKYAKGKLIDIGCGKKPYENLTRDYVNSHIGLDHESSIHGISCVDIIGTAYDIPVEDNTFDTILCTAVLEHLEKPADAIREMHRVLDSGGNMILTAPLYWHIHEEPLDFYRYTEYGLKYLLETNGFDILELKPMSGFCVTFGQELLYFLWLFRRGGPINPLWWLIPPVGALLQVFCYLLNIFDKSTIFTWMYILVGRKTCER